MSNYLKRITSAPSPQMEQDSPDQVKNNAGGFVYKISGEAQVRRFLILGSEGGTYYASERKLTKDNTLMLQKFAKVNARKLVDLIVEVSTNGLAPKQSPGLFALAIAASVPDKAEDRAYALAALPRVARTASTLFEFISYVTEFRGWGNALKRAVSEWYLERDAEQVGYQVAKYRNRNGYTHRDILRLAHPKAVSGSAHDKLFKAIVSEGDTVSGVPESYEGFIRARSANSALEAIRVMESFSVAWEYFNTSLHKDAEFWMGLIDNNRIPVGAVIRNLPRFSSLGLDSSYTDKIIKIMKDEKNRNFLHPVNMTIARNAYASGENKNLSWSVDRKILNALDDLVVESFKNAKPTGKRVLVAVDVSGSMHCANSQPLTPAEMSQITTLGLKNADETVDVVAFTSNYGSFWSVLSPVDIHANDTIKQVGKKFRGFALAGTDCALPMVWAKDNNKEYDAFVVLTDNETWAGNVKPDRALKDYRKSSGITDAKLVVAAFTPTKFSIADPKDRNMLDVVGTDSSVLDIINNFIAGRV